jgi:hypothetical protein
MDAMIGWMDGWMDAFGPRVNGYQETSNQRHSGQALAINRSKSVGKIDQRVCAVLKSQATTA